MNEVTLLEIFDDIAIASGIVHDFLHAYTQTVVPGGTSVTTKD